MKQIIVILIALLLPCVSFAGTGQIQATIGMWSGGVATPSCTEGDILSESFDPTGGDNSWTQGYVSAGCSSTLDQAAPSATGFSTQCYATSVDADAYSEAWHHWTDGAARSTVYIRFYVYITSEGLADNNQYRIFAYGSNTTYPIDLRFAVKQYSGNLELVVQGSDMDEDQYVISTSTPYLIEIYAKNNASSDEFEWKVNGVSQGAQSGVLFASDFQKIDIGVHPDTSVAATLSAYIDKLDISSTAWLGSCE